MRAVVYFVSLMPAQCGHAQATFYQRVYELTPETYAPLLAIVIPVGGIIGEDKHVAPSS